MSRYRNAVSSLFALMAIGAVIDGVDAKPPSRIIGGELATGSEFSAAVTLSYPGHSIHTCGAAIIGPRHVLTAGHCVDERSSSEISIRAGINDIRDSPNAVERLVSKVIIHPMYIPYVEGRRRVRDDLAILVLEEALPIGDRIKSLMLPVRRPQEGCDYVIAGWGNNHFEPTTYQYELKTLSMRMGDAKICNKFGPRTICAYAYNGTACPGDSGSPLMRDGYIYGIASTSICAIGHRVTFVNVYEYLNWIKAVIRRNP